MKLIKQIILEYRAGKSDKLYEVDLCEAAADRFVVNFRYGRRGSTLREGTKTSEPVSQDDAEKIFEKLVTSKTQKGYRETTRKQLQSTSENSASEQIAAEDNSEKRNPRADAVLKRLSEGRQSDSSWKLSRAVWRAGELKLNEAEPLLLSLLGSEAEMLDYSIAWALGQLGGKECCSALFQLKEADQTSEKIRRISTVALLQITDGTEREQLLNDCITQLPEKIIPLVQNGPAEGLEQTVQELLSQGDRETFAILDDLYWINNEHVRPVLLNLFQTAPLSSHYFQRIRHIFKAAELRRDAEVLGLLAYRIEKVPPNSRCGYSAVPYDNPVVQDDQNSVKAFGYRTKSYLRRRVWWTLRRLGELENTDYVPLAAQVLARYTDADAVFPHDQVRYDWNARSSTDGYKRIVTRYDRYAPYLAFNHILYGNSPRYKLDNGKQNYCCQGDYKPGDPFQADVREESFPWLWEQQPGIVLQLISQSACEVVHRFAVSVLRDCRDYCRTLAVESVLSLLAVEYLLTNQFGLELAVDRYDAKSPDRALLLGLADCSYNAARQQAYSWISDQKEILLKESEFLVNLLSCSQIETREFCRNVLQQTLLSNEENQAIIGRIFTRIQTLSGEENELAVDLTKTLMELFSSQLSTLGEEVIRDLLNHDLPEIQSFAGRLVLNHQVFSSSPAPDILVALLSSEEEAVVNIGVQILQQLSDELLKDNSDALVSLVCHKHLAIRELIRPTIARLAGTDSKFGHAITEKLVSALLIPGAPEGVPSFTSQVIREDLWEFLDRVPSETVWELLNSRSAPAQEVGGILLATNVKTEEFSVQNIVTLAGHEILSIREAAWKMCVTHQDKLQADLESAIRLLDVKWDDSRQFAFQYFRDHFLESGQLSPELLVSICDGVRPEVQQFGRELVTRLFDEEHAEEFLLKFSEHPSIDMQLFTTSFLERYRGENGDDLQQLMPFIVSVLSRVNQGRVVKDRVYRFLEEEALKSESNARVVATILDRQSATSAIEDKATTIELMLKIHVAYPTVSLPIQVQPVEVRNGV